MTKIDEEIKKLNTCKKCGRGPDSTSVGHLEGYREAAMDFRRMMNTGFTWREAWDEVFKPATIAASSLDLKPVPTKKSLKDRAAEHQSVRREHVEWKCTLGPDKCDDCNYDRHPELFTCAVCGQSEAELEPECPGPKRTSDTSSVDRKTIRKIARDYFWNHGIPKNDGQPDPEEIYILGYERALKRTTDAPTVARSCEVCQSDLKNLPGIGLYCSTCDIEWPPVSSSTVREGK
jgi:hypothetical protein